MKAYCLKCKNPMTVLTMPLRHKGRIFKCKCGNKVSIYLPQEYLKPHCNSTLKS